jgi:hypothetical protein
MLKGGIALVVFTMSFSLFAGCINYAMPFANGQKDISFDGKGSIECGNGKQFKNGNILLTGFQDDRGQFYGSFEIFFGDKTRSPVSQGGVLERGDIDSRIFDVEGLVLSDTLCNNTTPKPITILGSCEKVSVVDVKTADEQKGRFEGKVACPVVQKSGAPVAEVSGPSEVLGGEEVVLDASNSYDPDRDELTFSWRQIGGPSAKVLDVNGQKSTLVTPAVKETSIIDFEVEVTDIDGAADTSTLSMVILPKESSPVAEVSGPSEVLGGEEVVLDASNSYDPDRDELTFSWRQIGGPHVGLTGSDQAISRFTAPMVDQNFSLVFEATVKDSKGESDSDNVQVLVKNYLEEPLANTTLPNTTIPIGIPIANDTSQNITEPSVQPPPSSDQPPPSSDQPPPSSDQPPPSSDQPPPSSDQPPPSSETGPAEEED